MGSMITFPLNEQDIPKLNELWKKFYEKEFPFPDFRKFLLSFKIVNSEGTIITAGGLKLTPEMILITDKEQMSAKRAFALTSALQICSFHARAQNFDLISASVVNDEKWLEQLRSIGFRDSIGTHLVIG